MLLGCRGAAHIPVTRRLFPVVCPPLIELLELALEPISQQAGSEHIRGLTARPSCPQHLDHF
eukprot:3243253-Prymnesium_polylepis.4